MPVKLAPSKNPEKESKIFSIIAFVAGILSLFLYPLAIIGAPFGVRGAILSHRVKNAKLLVLAIIGGALSLVSLIYAIIT